MKLGLSQTPRLEQRLVQSPQMIQAMQILQLSSLDLQDRVEQELTENPFLEEVEPGESETREEDHRGETAEEPETQGVESMLEELERYERDFGDGPPRSWDGEEGDRKLEAMRNTPARHHSLSESLLDQLALLDLDEREREIAELLIGSLNERGYLVDSLEELAGAASLEGANADELDAVLAKLRDAIHPALGARDLRECLLLQLDAHPDPGPIGGPLVRQLVDEHLEDITTNRIPRIAKATGRTIEEVQAAIEHIRHLDPAPGWEFGGSPAAVITPDVIVEELDGRYEVRLARQRVPELRVSSAYKSLLQQARRGDGVQEWIKKRLESARWFIDAVHQRQNTMLRIAEAIFEKQSGFLDKGVRGLEPLRMQEVADKAGVHISTVSRAVAGKYAQTPRGIHPLKYFFTSGTTKASGGVASQASIKDRIRELVEREDSHQPLSDDQIAELLETKDGIKIARRTVTKYRKTLAIPASNQRRKF